MKEKKTLRFFRMFLVAVICVMCLIPFYVLLVLSLNEPSRVFYEGNIFVPTFTWSNYGAAWAKSRVGQAMINSAIITFGTLSLTIVLGGMAGYAIARRNTAYNKFVFSLLIGCMMIPGIINTVPLYPIVVRAALRAVPAGRTGAMAVQAAII